jgi:hypothetical protein
MCTDCQAFYPVVRIGSPHSLTRKRVLLLPHGSMGGNTLACGGGGVRGPNSDDGTDILAVYVGLLYNPATRLVLDPTFL